MLYRNDCQLLKHPKIFICGEQGVGKSYLSNWIADNRPCYKQVKIAQPLYDMVELIREDRYSGLNKVLEDLGFDLTTTYFIRGEIGNDIIEDVKSSIKPRYALQKLGDIIRKYNENALIERALNISKDHPVIIDDVRLGIEGDALNKGGFVGVRLEADPFIRKERLSLRDGAYKKASEKHKTESEFNKIPVRYHFNNSDDYTLGEGYLLDHITQHLLGN